MGAWSTCFALYCWKPLYFDPCLKKNTNHWKQAVTVSLIFILLFSLFLCFFYYVEFFVTIPKNWFALVEKICPRMKNTDMLHYHNFNGMAVLLYVVSFYFIKALNNSYSDYQIQSRPSEAVLFKIDSMFAVVIKILVFGFTDYFFSRIVPKMIFGTHTLNY